METNGKNSAKNILIVDDSRVSLYLIRYILMAEGYGVMECTDGESAILRAVARMPDLVLMDINLPDMSGLEATRLIHGRTSPLRIPVIAVSGYKSDGDHRRAFGAGCIACVDKPFERATLIRVVRVVLEGSQDVFPASCSKKPPGRRASTHPSA